MNGKQNEPKLTYALDSSGKMVSIRNVERGLACNCCCPKCKEPLVAAFPDIVDFFYAFLKNSSLFILHFEYYLSMLKGWEMALGQ